MLTGYQLIITTPCPEISDTPTDKLVYKEITLSLRWPRDAPNMWVPWKLYAYVSAKSADDCARISTLQTYRYSMGRWNYFRSIPSNVITAPSDLNVTHGQTDGHCGITPRRQIIADIIGSPIF